MKKFVNIIIAFALASSGALAQSGEMPIISVGQLSTTHVLFTTDLTYVDISMPEFIAAKIVDVSKNMLALKARSEFDFITTISALETNGTMHTFKVKYESFPERLLVDTRPGAMAKENVNTQIRPDGDAVNATETPRDSTVSAKTVSGKGKSRKSVKRRKTASSNVNVITTGTSNFGRYDAPTIEEITKYPQGIYHIGDKVFNVEILCSNIFVYSDMTYIVLTINNNTDIGFDAGDAQFTIENVTGKSRALATDKAIWPKSSYGSLSCAPRSSSVVGYTIPKMTLLKDECLKIYIYEKSGKRNLILTLSDKDVNYAISPK